MSIEIKLILDSTHSCNICIEQMNTDLGSTFPYTPCMPWNSGMQRSLRSSSRNSLGHGKEAEPWCSPFSSPSRSPNMTRVNAALHVTAWNTRLGKSPTRSTEGMGTDHLLQSGQTVTSWEKCGNDLASGRNEGRRQGQAEAGYADHCECRSVEQRT